MSSSCSLVAQSSLTLYSNWQFCSACGLPPVDLTSKKSSSSPTNGENADTNGCVHSATNEASGNSKDDGNRNNNNNNNNKYNNTYRIEHKRPQNDTTTAVVAKKNKLSTCRRCKTAAYHNSECQKNHWKRGHKRDCKVLAEAIQPLLDIVRCWNDFHGKNNNNNNNNRRWWDVDKLDPKGAMQCHRLWKTNEVRWNRHGEYLEGMGGFQRALEPIMKLWKDRPKETTTARATKGTTTENGNSRDEKAPLITMSNLSMNDHNDDDDHSSITIALGISLARKLLFCAYCEADGNQIITSRARLAQCISILLECSFLQIQQRHKQSQQHKINITSLLNDAWMEIMLSYEEERSPELRKISRHVAHLAIQTSCGNTLYDCEWKDPLQRPGYMAKLEATTNTKHIRSSSLVLDPPFVPPEEHPAWCRTLESHWKEIAEELFSLIRSNSTQTLSSRRSNNQTEWTAVGSGDRGSGGDDHRVVSAGGKWTEYVLFGTGAEERHRSGGAPFTKRLLRSCVPDAVSLAEAGGGEVIFSKLAPRTRIDAHCGPTNFRWTAHLGLVIPSTGSCSIKVADEWHEWATGKILLFDDSYEHEIRNDTDEVRVVLLLRFWHPSLGIHQRQTKLKEAVRRKEEAIEKRYHAPPV